MKRIHGRKNQPLEFVEFRCANQSGAKMTYVAQRAGDRWNTYEIAPKCGPKVHGLNWRSLKDAEAVVRKAAEIFEAGR